MVQIGKTIKFDGNGRITIPMELAKLLNLEKGMDEIYWDVTGGEATQKKVTKKYHGLDFEGDEIKERLQKYEQDYIENYDPDSEDPEKLMTKAREQYEKDKALREEVIRNRSKNNSQRSYKHLRSSSNNKPGSSGPNSQSDLFEPMFRKSSSG
jgi:bifunctional DNA-binding transcriptional regulator/antitoxin component of YhaV-PrlF toxin-antitoxin module